MNSQDRSRSLSPSRNLNASVSSLSSMDLSSMSDDASSSDLIRGYRMDRLRANTIEQRKYETLKNLTERCNYHISQGDLKFTYSKQLIGEDIRDWLLKELDTRGVDAYYCDRYLNIYLDDANQASAPKDWEEESDSEEYEYESEDSTTEEFPQSPSYHNQLVLLFLILMIVVMYYIKVCYLNSNSNTTNLGSIGCKEISQYFNRTAQQFAGSTRASVEENSPMFG